MGDGCDFARWEEDEKRDLSKQLRVECALGTRRVICSGKRIYGCKSGTCPHAQKHKPTNFDCLELCTTAATCQKTGDLVQCT